MRTALLALVVFFGMVVAVAAAQSPIHAIPVPATVTVYNVTPVPVFVVPPVRPRPPVFYYLSPPPIKVYEPKYYAYVAPRVVVRPKVYVEGRPLRNLFQAITP